MCKWFAQNRFFANKSGKIRIEFYRHMLNTNLVLKFWRPGPKGREMAVNRVGVFCNRYNELAFLCNGTDRHEIREKTSVAVLYWTLIEEFWKFALKGGVILLQTVIFGLLWRFSIPQTYRSGVTFLTYRSLPSIRGRARPKGVPTLNRLFVRLTVSAVEVPKVTQISLSEP